MRHKGPVIAMAFVDGLRTINQPINQPAKAMEHMKGRAIECAKLN